jgi:hypothetical protein
VVTRGGWTTGATLSLVPYGVFGMLSDVHATNAMLAPFIVPHSEFRFIYGGAVDYLGVVILPIPYNTVLLLSHK